MNCMWVMVVLSILRIVAPVDATNTSYVEELRRHWLALDALSVRDASSWTENVTDRYRGWWRRERLDEAVAFPWTDCFEGGVVAFVHTGPVADGDDLAFVKLWGDVVVREGMYDTQNGFALKLEGLYWPRLGLLLAVARPKWSLEVIPDISVDFKGLKSIDEALGLVARSVLNITVVASAAPESWGPSHPCHYAVVARASTREEFEEPEWRRAKWKPPRLVGVASPYLYLDGFFLSPSCNASLNFTLKSVYTEQTRAQVTVYFLLSLGVSFVAHIGLLRQMRNAASSMRAARISRVSVVLTVATQGYVAILHCLLALFIMDGLLRPLVFLGFLQLMDLSLYEFRYLLRVWLAHQNVLWNPNLFRWFYVGGCFLLMALHFVPESYGPFLLIPFYLFWIPQILYNVKHQTRYVLDWWYVWGVTLSRFFPVAYFFAFEPNFLVTAPHRNLVLFIALLLVMQILCLAVQDWLGPRFWTRHHEPTFDYQPKQAWVLAKAGLVSDIEAPPKECAICLAAISQEDVQANHFMITPCTHAFHAQCLLRWMHTKLVCPVCRLALPPVDETGLVV